MKKTLILSLLLVSFYSYSQVSIGINAGILAPSSAKKSGYLVPEIGYKVGFEAIIKVYKGLHIRTGIDYNSFDFSQDFKVTNQNGYVTTNVTVNAKVNYVGIPLGLRYVFTEKVLSPFVDLTVYQLVKVSEKYSSNTAKYSYAKTNSSITSPSIGLGVLFNPGKHIYATFQASYIAQMKPVYQAPIEVHYNSVGAVFSLGYKF